MPPAAAGAQQQMMPGSMGGANDTGVPAEEAGATLPPPPKAYAGGSADFDETTGKYVTRVVDGDGQFRGDGPHRAALEEAQQEAAAGQGAPTPTGLGSSSVASRESGIDSGSRM